MRNTLLGFIIILLPALMSCSHFTTPAATTQAQRTVSATVGKARIPHAAIKPGEVREMTLKELGNFEFDPKTETAVPADVQALNGSMVRLRGFMVETTSPEPPIKEFALVTAIDVAAWAGVQHVVTCRLAKGHELSEVTMDEAVVEGKLTVRVKREDGYSYSIFELDVTSVKLAG